MHTTSALPNLDIAEIKCPCCSHVDVGDPDDARFHRRQLADFIAESLANHWYQDGTHWQNLRDSYRGPVLDALEKWVRQ